MVSLFDITTINGMTLSNRFVRSAAVTGAASTTGFVTAPLIDLMVQLVDGGVGLIITGAAFTTKNGQTISSLLGISHEDHIPGLRTMVEGVHNAGGTIVAQIGHGGIDCNPTVIGEVPLGPSATAPFTGKGGAFGGCRAMTTRDIDTVITAFAHAARRAQTAGFDGVQLHSAHGATLHSQFLSPVYNKRTDKYGGSVENRARFVLETYHAIRNTVGDDYPVMIKLNTTEFHEDGITRADFLSIATELEQAGIDAIELSGGITWNLLTDGDINRTFARNVTEEAYYRDIAQLAKQHLTIPTILTGGIRSYEVADQIVTDGIADYIGLGRPLIREPNLVNRWKAGDTTKSECVSDNACMFTMMTGQILHCVHLAS